MPARYDKQGLRFLYPENWRLDEQELSDAEVATVAVYSPGGAFWTISAHNQNADPQTLIDQALTTMREVYDELDAEPFNEPLADRPTVGYEMNFYCLDLTNTAWVRSFRADNATYVLFCQGEDRELREIEPVFRAITQSFVQEL